MGRVRIRQARRADACAMDSLVSDVGTTESSEFQSRLEKLEGYLALQDSGEAYALVAEADSGAEELVAWAIARVLSPPICSDYAPAGWYLMGVFVRPDRRRTGLGRRLTTERLRWLSRSARSVYYFTTNENQASTALHEGFGFRSLRSGLSPSTLAFDGGPSVLYELSGEALQRFSHKKES